MDIFMFCISMLFLCFVSGANLKWTDCTNNPQSPFTISGVNIQPLPVEFPGNVRLSVNATLVRSVGSSTFDVRVWRKNYLFGEIRIPCFMNFGSCRFPELCSLVNDMITNNWLGVTRSVGRQLKTMFLTQGIDPTVCPVQPMNPRIYEYPISLPDVPSLLVWFAAGEYRAEIRIIENATGKEMVCVNTEMTVTQRPRPCSGWFC